MFAEASQLRRVVLEVTEACNHRCVHCYNYWDHPTQEILAADTLSRAAIRRLIRRVSADAPLEHVVISGGEPLVRPDLPEIAGDLVDDGLLVTVITNATLLTEALAARLRPEAQIDVTLFSADEAVHDRIAGPVGAFRRTIDGIVAARERGCALAVTVVVGAFNAHDVYRTIELALGLGAEAIMLNRVNLTPRMLQESQHAVPTLQQLREALWSAELVAGEYDVTVGVSVPVPPCLLEPAEFPHLRFGYCPRGGEDSYYTISHNGLLRPCNHSSVVLGNLRRQRFAEVIDSAATREFWAAVPVECASCAHPLREDCRGGCPAAAEECGGSRDHVDPFVLRLAPNITMAVSPARH
jgi:radical SAM protein with 4Fe4S-binding SPASM domain